jgi:hypothetical protein
VLLWRREAIGYLTGLALLFQARMLFIAPVFLFGLRPILIRALLTLSDIVAVLLTGMI